MSLRKKKQTIAPSKLPVILVCGGRNYDNRYQFINTLHKIIDDEGWTTPKDKYGNYLPAVRIVCGGAPGADAMAIDFAIVNWTDFKEYKADWAKHGKAAGPIRNREMFDTEKPDLVLAFPGGKGTADMVAYAKSKGARVIEVTDEEDLAPM